MVTLQRGGNFTGTVSRSPVRDVVRRIRVSFPVSPPPGQVSPLGHAGPVPRIDPRGGSRPGPGFSMHLSQLNQLT